MTLRVDHIFNALQRQGIEFFSGVPDSLLKDFCAYITDHAGNDNHVIAANEGNAIALAIGWYLGTGKLALVYMQNSGFGNAVNPLTSLADPDVYGIPMLIMVGWRGEPGVKDEPQHVKQGRIMPGLLDTLELPWYMLDSATTDASEVIDEACLTARKRKIPAVLLVRNGSFEPYKLKHDRRVRYTMNREEALKLVVSNLNKNDLIVSTTGMTSRELFEYREMQGQDHVSDFLTLGGMGHTASIAMGLARAQPKRKVICLDGDGSTLMHMGALSIIGQSRQKNLIHIVINNGCHDSVGGQPTVAFDTDLCAVAIACGYSIVHRVEDSYSLNQAIVELLPSDGPIFLEIRVNKGARTNLGRPHITPQENKRALMFNLGVEE
jgi:phosphonopyruvate decarboxylase